MDGKESVAIRSCRMILLPHKNQYWLRKGMHSPLLCCQRTMTLRAKCHFFQIGFSVQETPAFRRSQDEDAQKQYSINYLPKAVTYNEYCNPARSKRAAHRNHARTFWRPAITLSQEIPWYRGAQNHKAFESTCSILSGRERESRELSHAQPSKKQVLPYRRIK